MDDVKTPFWEESYSRPGKLDTFYGGLPDKEITDTAAKLAPGAKVLDFGCGEGRNALYLAEHGLDTTATDISQSGIDKLNTVSKEKGLSIEASAKDMREFKFDKTYDLIACQGVLHLLPPEDRKVVMEKMMRATSRGGYHVIRVFTDTIPEPEDQRGLMVGLFSENELFEIYKDWEIIYSNSEIFHHTHPGSISHSHSKNEIIARKP